MDWRDIPSLSALRAFESAARLRSYSTAARELNVTHAAIAQHVRTLERHFDRRLMVRSGQTMQPTEDGVQLARALETGFETIAQTVRDLLRPETRKPVRVTSTPSFAENWLMPRIGAFWAAHPDIQIEIVPSQALDDLRRDGFDLGLRYGRGDWPDLKAEPIAQARHTVVAAPGQVATGLESLREASWILVGQRREDDFALAALGLDVTTLKTRYFDTGSLVLQAVRSNLGISIQPWPIVKRDVELGQLEVLAHVEEDTQAYYLVTPPGPISDRAQTFIKWLKSHRDTG